MALDKTRLILFDIVAWLTEPKETALMSRGFAGDDTTPKSEPAPIFQREAQVKNKKTNAPVAVSVRGTAKQWAFASVSKVEAYPSEDNKVLYFQPHMADSGTAADALGL